MTGQEIQERLDALVADLQTIGKGQTINFFYRAPDGSPNTLPLSSDASGNVNAGQLALIQGEVDNMKTIADAYEQEYAPVKTASEAFRAAREAHRDLIDAASQARQALEDALVADQDYQTAKTAYEAARNDADYISARNAYKTANVSENYGNLGEAKGKYQPAE